MKIRMFLKSGIILAMVGMVSCEVRTDQIDSKPLDTGWLANDSFEVQAVLTSTLKTKASGKYSEIATDAKQQGQLIDMQFRYAKKQLIHHGYHLNQLVDKATVINVVEEDDHVSITYEAVVDLIKPIRSAASISNEVESLPKTYEIKLPADPVNVSWQVGSIGECADEESDTNLRELNYYYYFNPAEENCNLTFKNAQVTLTQVNERKEAYPEYDQLLKVNEENGLKGFKAAILPNRGDEDPESRFDAHKEMLESELGLVGEDSDDGKYREYLWTENGVQMVVHLYNPANIATYEFTDNFHKTLSEYQLVYYNGHSSYGSREFLTNKDAYMKGYQILVMHSCRSYPYYSRQVFRAKASEEDPRGWANADVVATGESSYPMHSPVVLGILLKGLMQGIVAASGSDQSRAPSWLSITERMNRAIPWGILYGVAGVRTNQWQPDVSN